MQIDPAAEWLRLTQVYGKMGDIELRELDAGRGDLTEVAQQVLRDELRKRGVKPLSDRADAAAFAAAHAARPAPSTIVRDDPPDDADEPQDGLPQEFTWKTQLCECLDRQQAAELSEVLRQAGIESWIQTPYSAFGLLYPRVFVAADQLEQAREIADRPIPQAIVNEADTEPEEFELPCCPKCGAQDPVLESADPTNHWFCEVCEAEWSDPAENPDESPAAR
jgi:hypothetical protein